MITGYSSVVAPSINQDKPEIKLLIAFLPLYSIKLNPIGQIHQIQPFWPGPIQSIRLIEDHEGLGKSDWATQCEIDFCII